MTGRIVVVGLGPGGVDHVTVEWECGIPAASCAIHPRIEAAQASPQMPPKAT